MWECNFAKEPMDYKLFWLRFVKKIWIVLAALVLGACVVGIPYYLVNITFGEGPEYQITSEYYLDYAEDGSGATYEYFNYYTWSEIVDTDEFLAILKDVLPDEMFINDNELRAYTDATVESDTRYLTTVVSTEHPDKTEIVARAMEKAIIWFAQNQKELNSARVITAPENATISYPDVRCGRAIILGAVIGVFIGLLYVSVMLICDSSIYLPSTLERRYGIKAMGCESFSETKNNICYQCKDVKKAAFLWTDTKSIKESESLITLIKDTLSDACEIVKNEKDVLAKDFDFENLRKTDKVFLMVKAGAHNGKKIERMIEQIKRQDIEISGAFLYKEDKKLVYHYYK